MCSGIKKKVAKRGHVSKIINSRKTFFIGIVRVPYNEDRMQINLITLIPPKCVSLFPII